ncbi:MAG TPA: hypothetical protein VGJ04_07600, partial [Pirellulales bacterium]
MRTIQISALLFCALFVVIGSVARADQSTPSGNSTNPPTDLSGQWRFAMDRDDGGVKAEWFNRELAAHIQLPGILQSQGYGDEIGIDTPWVAALPRDMRWYLLPQYKAYTTPGNIKVPYLSQPPRHYLGVAWYQRDLEIPAAWQGKHIHLLLERPRWETTVWVDDNKIGSNNSLVAPHEYELGILTPGKHQLTVRADNRMSVVPKYRPDGHSVSDALGATWNGIAGRIELSATSPVWIDDAQVFPNVEKNSATVRVQIGNLTGKPGTGTLEVVNGEDELLRHSVPVQWDTVGGTAALEIRLGKFGHVWDEFHPVLQHITVKLKGDSRNEKSADDSRQITFGVREITTKDKDFI